MSILNEIKSGVLFGRGKFDWQAGANSPIVRQELMPDKNWKKIELDHEIQFNHDSLYDTLFCVTYADLKAIAKLLTYLESVGAFTPIQLITLNRYKKNGKYNFSERFTGTLGETTSQGAYQFKIAQAIRNYGLIPQDMFPLADNFQDNIDKKFITEEMYRSGREFLEIISFNYEWVDNMPDYLKYSPIPLIVRFANYEKLEDILNPVGALNHQVCGVLSTTEYNEIEDSYQQRYKRYEPEATHHFMAFYITINNKSMDVAKFIKDNDKNQVRNVNTGGYGVIYAGKLMEIKQERAGLYMIDRDARGLVGKGKTVPMTNADWEQIKNTKDADGQPLFFAYF
jgi:hypothetical protein